MKASNMFAKPELIHAAVLSVVYSSYIGLVLFRVNGHGRLPFNVFFNSATTAK